MVKVISMEQAWSMGSYLRTAARRFDEFAKAVDDLRLQEQFRKQSREAHEFATILENAEFVEVTETEEVRS